MIRAISESVMGSSLETKEARVSKGVGKQCQILQR